MSKRILLIGLLLIGCSAPATAKYPGIYECFPTDIRFSDIESIWFDTEIANTHGLFGSDRGVGIEFTTLSGKRISLYESSPGAWECVLQKEQMSKPRGEPGFLGIKTELRRGVEDE